MVNGKTLQNKRVLIIGAGQVGVFASRELSAEGAIVYIADIRPDTGFINRFGNCRDIERVDVTDSLEVKNLIGKVVPDIIILAYGISTVNIAKNKALAERVNVKSIKNISDAVLRSKAERVIYISSFAVYDNFIGAGSINESTELVQHSLYATQKIRAERLLKKMLSPHINVIILRPCGCYGPTLYNRGSQSSRLIESLLVLSENQKKIKLAKQGEEEFIYVKDLASAIVKCSVRKMPEAFSIFNIGTGVMSSTGDIVEALTCNYPDVSVEVVNGSEVNKKTPLSVKKANDVLGFQSRYSLSEGMRDFKNLVNFTIT